METSRLRQELMRPGAYAHPVEEVGFLQTHISLLFFAGDRVYKVKKPVDLGFLDFTTLERRRHFCEEEVRLNRRLAPRVYRGVVPIVASEPGLTVGGAGEPIEWAVEMDRLPAERMLDRLLERGEVDNEQMNAIARLLVDFHREAATGAGIDEHGSPAAVRANVDENLEQSEAFVAGREGSPGVLSERQLAFLRERRRAFLDRDAALLERRVAEGRVREGHGDLHAGNLCFTAEGPVAYDCIEFNRRFRCGDVAADLAFLTMNLDYRGYPGFSKYLATRYSRLADDPDLLTVEPFYKGYRAVVRGKVTAMTASDPDVGAEQREGLIRESMRHYQLAVAYELPPAMVLTCGLPGSGKSWMARRLAGSLRAAVLHSDVRRKVLSGVAPTSHQRGEFAQGMYSRETTERTYRSLLESALSTLRSGHSVIVDATFSKRIDRARFVDATERMGLPYFVLHVSAPDEVIRDRLERRVNETREISDADLGVYLEARKTFEEPTEVPDGHLVACRSGLDVPETQSSLVLDRMIELAPRP